MTTTLPEAADTRLDRHPPGLYALFTAEMWERLSYYGMRALLVLYLTKALGYVRADALAVYAVYTGLVYLTPLIGGRLSDRYLGQRKAVFIGGVLMALGQLALTQRAWLFEGLGLLIVGNGFFKPNISTMVGGLYPQGDHRRDGAYTIFYMGINLGAFIAPLICGPLGERFGWWPGFATAGLGMMFGVLTFGFTQRLIQGVGLPPGREVHDRATLAARDYLDVAALSAVGVAFVFLAVRSWHVVQPIWSPAFLTSTLAAAVYKGGILVGLLGLFLYLTEPRKSASQEAAAHERLTSVDWQRLGVILIISLFSIVFWAGFEQSGGTLNLFADEKVDRHVLGWEMPASILQAVNPLFIIVMAPVFALLWTYLAKRRFPLPSVTKQGLGLVLLGVAFGVMFLADREARTGKVSVLWLIAVYFVFTVAELFISPIGLSLVNKLAHPRVASLMMATWFLCTAAANYLAGMMEQLIEPLHLNLWAFLGALAFVPGLLMVALTPVLVKMSHGRV